MDILDTPPCFSHCGNHGESGQPFKSDGLGKKAEPISDARIRVLEILEAENACTAWFRTITPDPARVFRSLQFTVDTTGIDYVIEQKRDAESREYVHPYVATVLQNGGEYQVVTLNAGGAFFRSASRLVRVVEKGGPGEFRGSHMLKVGPYLGDTQQARMTTLLHELGHVLGLLPLDSNDANGQSSANTREVLRYCQPEIESMAKHRFLSATR